LVQPNPLDKFGPPDGPNLFQTQDVSFDKNSFQMPDFKSSENNSQTNNQRDEGVTPDILFYFPFEGIEPLSGNILNSNTRESNIALGLEKRQISF
jgi:hypothetical protein